MALAMSSAEIISGTITAPARLDKALAEATELSRARVQVLIAEGRVEVAGAPATSPSSKVAEGAHFSITVPPAIEAEAKPQDIPLDIAFEDEHLIVVNKPAGMVVHPAAGNPDGTLVNALLHHCAGQLSGIGGVARPGIVHRIDKDTTGVLVVAKTEQAHKGLSDLFASHTIDRTYLALTRGSPRPSAGTIQTDIARSPKDRKKMAVVPDGEGRHAVTHYKVLESYGEISKVDARPAAALIECRLETGRTHQIRVHMAHRNCSLIGDPVYGRHRGIKAHGRGEAFDTATVLARKLTRQALHAASLGFTHPVTGQSIFVETPLPPDLHAVRAALRKL